MKIKFIIPMIGAILLGYFCGKVLCKDYIKDSTTGSEVNIVYFLQQGVYSSKESMEANVKNLSDYLYQVEDNKYYVYSGITSSKDNAKKIKDLYQENNINIYIKPAVEKNKGFLSNLVQYDILLSSSNTISEISSILKAILASYNEFKTVN
ncbi:MAG: hypothetical protein RR047_02970 [Bacilli bacterium]